MHILRRYAAACALLSATDVLLAALCVVLRHTLRGALMLMMLSLLRFAPPRMRYVKSPFTPAAAPPC